MFNISPGINTPGVLCPFDFVDPKLLCPNTAMVPTFSLVPPHIGSMVEMGIKWSIAGIVAGMVANFAGL